MLKKKLVLFLNKVHLAINTLIKEKCGKTLRFNYFFIDWK